MKLKVLYEDNHLIAVFKPAGILVQADKSDSSCLMDEVKLYLKEKYEKPGKVFLGLLHRLDRNVCGIVLFAKTGKGASRLSAQFRERTIEKKYMAWVSGRMIEDQATLIHYLLKNKKNNFVEIVKENTAGAMRAELSFKVLKTQDDYSLLEIKLATGRPHQIRVQLSAMGHPIVGDVKYGSKKLLPNNLIALCAVELEFNLAAKDERKKIQIEFPYQDLSEISKKAS
ncbi:RNA pseudouridine synthase [Patescibacteria group bacterium]|nr:RNA pseudouridine synthase [Patescibacteria group bacterium]